MDCGKGRGGVGRGGGAEEVVVNGRWGKCRGVVWGGSIRCSN